MLLCYVIVVAVNDANVGAKSRNEVYVIDKLYSTEVITHTTRCLFAQPPRVCVMITSVVCSLSGLY